jgi:hypothetical protein
MSIGNKSNEITKHCQEIQEITLFQIDFQKLRNTRFSNKM